MLEQDSLLCPSVFSCSLTSKDSWEQEDVLCYTQENQLQRVCIRNTDTKYNNLSILHICLAHKKTLQYY